MGGIYNNFYKKLLTGLDDIITILEEGGEMPVIENSDIYNNFQKDILLKLKTIADNIGGGGGGQPTAFAIGEPDLDNKVLITSVTTNTDINFTLTEASYILVRGQGTQPSASGAIAFDLYKDVKDADHFVHSQMVYTTRHGYVALVYVPAGNYIMATDAQSAILRSVYRVPSKKIAVIRPQVIALPGKVDFIADTQIGWKEISTGVFKPKYEQNYSWAGTQNSSGTVTLTGASFNTTEIQIVGVNALFGILYSTGLQFRLNGHVDSVISRCTIQIQETTITGTIIFGSGLTGLRSVNAKIEYIKNADPTYTWEQILAMNPQA